MNDVTYKDVLLISEDYVKSESMLDSNTAGKFLLTAIKLSQDVELRSIIGKCLLEKLQTLVFDKEIEDLEWDYYSSKLQDVKLRFDESWWWEGLRS